MNVLFEEDGSFKAGQILADNNTSLQVELPTGKRAKVKSANVLLRFVQPGAAELMKSADEASNDIDTDFLWSDQTEQNRDTFGDLPDTVGLRRARIGAEGNFTPDCRCR